MGNCLRCGKEFEDMGVNTTCSKKFCSTICRTRYNAYKRYYRIKDTKKYKKKRRKYFREWLERNREHFNDLVRERNRINQQRRREEARKKGLCTRCFKRKPIENRKLCQICLKYKRERNRKRKLNKLKNE